ncbi:PaaI family thioesterase [Tsuneonella sp. HG094]
MTDHLTAYARALGIVAADAQVGDAPILSLPFDHALEGRPGAWHGGAIAGLLETAGYAALRSALDAKGRHPQLKPINVTVQYLSTGRTRESQARGRVVRLGRRVANLSIEAWQDDPQRPIATAVMNVLLVEPDLAY